VILSKGNLKVVEMTAPDKAIPMLDNVFIRKDGTTIGCNGRAILAVSPVIPKVREKAKAVLVNEKPLDRDFAVSSETAKEVGKTMPRDTMFSGLLEHCDVEDRGQSAMFTFSDGKRLKTLEGKKHSGEYIDFMEWIGSALRHAADIDDTATRVVVNRRRLMALLKAVDTICPDSAGEVPVYLEFTSQDEIILRCENPASGQRVLGVMGTYTGVEGKWPELGDWEKSFIKREAKVRKEKT
jgi:hypothetical protein